jgi:hypothetical protein
MKKNPDYKSEFYFLIYPTPHHQLIETFRNTSDHRKFGSTKSGALLRQPLTMQCSFSEQTAEQRKSTVKTQINDKQ